MYENRRMLAEHMVNNAVDIAAYILEMQPQYLLQFEFR